MSLHIEKNIMYLHIEKRFWNLIQSGDKCFDARKTQERDRSDALGPWMGTPNPTIFFFDHSTKNFLGSKRVVNAEWMTVEEFQKTVCGLYPISEGEKEFYETYFEGWGMVNVFYFCNCVRKIEEHINWRPR